MKTVSCDEMIRHPDGIVEIRYSENGVESGAITYEDEAARMARIMAIERRREEEILILLLALA